MGVAIEVLNPQDCLKQPFFREALVCPLSQTKHQKNHENPNRSKSNRVLKNWRTRPSPNRLNKPAPSTRSAVAVTVEKPANFLANGSVRILKRGENLHKTTPSLPTGETSADASTGSVLRETTTDPPVVSSSFDSSIGSDLSETTPDSPAVSSSFDSSIGPDLSDTTPASPAASSSSYGSIGSNLSCTTPDSPAVSSSSYGSDLSRTTPDSPAVSSSSDDSIGSDQSYTTVERLVAKSSRERARVRSGDPFRAEGFYAGSATYVVSPPPSSLPLPAFFSRKAMASNSEATSALMKILRLDLD